MLKRLLVLALLSAAMLLLMGLMVSGGAEQAPPPRLAAQTICLPTRAMPAPQAEQTPALSSQALELRRDTGTREFCCDQNGLPVCGGAYYSANYLSFHFSDRAG